MLKKSQIATVVNGLEHSEGIAWGPDERIYCGGESGQIYRADLAGSVEQIATMPMGKVCGVALDSAERVYGCHMVTRAIMRFDPATGLTETYFAGLPDDRIGTPNYISFDKSGNLYITDSGEWRIGEDDEWVATKGRVFKVTPDGQGSIWSDELAELPNGCALDVDETGLYVLLSLVRPGLYRIPINPDGSAGKAEVIAELPDTFPDGCALDVNGNIYATGYRPDCIWKITRGGDVEMLFLDKTGLQLCGPSNIAFGGPNLETMLIVNTSGRHISSVELGVQGAPIPFPVVRS